MMKHIDCEEAQEWIVADLDQSLDHDLRSALVRHLADCRECREARAAYQDIWTSLARDMPEDLGDDFWKAYRISLNAKLDTVSSGWWHAWSSWSFGWQAAAVLVPAMLALMVVFLGPSREQPYQLPIDDASCQRLLTELHEVYGPTSEESLSIAYIERVRTELWSAKKATTTGWILTWFEVEDEPNPPYL